MNKDTKKLISVGVGVAAATLTAVLGTYLAMGRRGKNAPLIPDLIEDRIDLVVAWLDRQLGKKWVDKGLDAIQSLLFSNLPQPLAMLADRIFEAEQQGRKEGWTGVQKRDFAKAGK